MCIKEASHFEGCLEGTSFNNFVVLSFLAASAVHKLPWGSCMLYRFVLTPSEAFTFHDVVYICSKPTCDLKRG